MNAAPGRSDLTVVVLTHDRREEALRTLAHLAGLPGRWPVVVVDNGSSDGTAQAVRQRFPDMTLVRTARNVGAAARNLGVQAAGTPYVAFCDDDTLWEPGALERAVAILDAAPGVGVLSARIVVGADRLPDPACEAMAGTPLESDGLPGHRILGFMAGACVMRRQAFLDAKGYWPPFFIGAEEALLALDLAALGWSMVYAPQVVSRHLPSARRDAPRRRYLLARNAIWTGWMRLPRGMAWRRTKAELRAARGSLARLRLACGVLAGMPRALMRRSVVAPDVQLMLARLE